ESDAHHAPRVVLLVGGPGELRLRAAAAGEGLAELQRGVAAGGFGGARIVGRLAVGAGAPGPVRRRRLHLLARAAVALDAQAAVAVHPDRAGPAPRRVIEIDALAERLQLIVGRAAPGAV